MGFQQQQRIEDLEKQVRHMAQVVHQACHTYSAVAWQECPQSFCQDAAKIAPYEEA